MLTDLLVSILMKGKENGKTFPIAEVEFSDKDKLNM